MGLGFRVWGSGFGVWGFCFFFPKECSFWVFLGLLWGLLLLIFGVFLRVTGQRGLYRAWLRSVLRSIDSFIRGLRDSVDGRAAAGIG